LYLYTEVVIAGVLIRFKEKQNELKMKARLTYRA